MNYEKRSISIQLSTEPPTLNSLTSTNVISSFVLGHIMEGLMQYDQSNNLSAAVAERWELREDGATFWLRRDALWSDGQPVTAHDFVFAWRMAVEPKTASQYAFILYPIKNAEAINRGEMENKKLGVVAVNDYQLEVSFESSCPYFLSLTAFTTYLPIREDFYLSRGQRYAAETTDMLYNGAFELTRWIHSSSLMFTKNTKYWARDKVHLETINIPYITSDPTAIFNIYQNNNIALAGLNEETIKEALKKSYPLHSFHTGAQYFLEFNHLQGRITSNRNFRKAVQAVIDPSMLVNKIMGEPGNLPGESLFPITVKGEKKYFREEYPAPVIDRNLAVARDYLSASKKELSIKEFPKLVLLVGDSPRAARTGEFFQYVLKQGLGLEVVIDSQVFKQYLENMRRGDFDIVLAGWSPDYDDPLTFADRFSSWNDNNRGRYKSLEYDNWVQAAQKSSNAKERMRAFDELQRIVSNDAVIVPTHERGAVYVQNPQLKGVVRRVFGADPDYKYAHVVEKAH